MILQWTRVHCLIFTGSGNIYTAIFTPSTNNECSIKVNGGEYSDTIGNPNSASNIFTWTFDGTVVINETSGETGVFTKESWTGAESPIAFEIGSGFTSGRSFGFIWSNQYH